MHQIRIHLSYLKAPIVTDHAYGGSDFFLSSVKRRFNVRQGEEEQPLIKRIALHAFSIGFETVDGIKLSVEAPYPKDFKVLVTQLNKNR
jgi:23S rRNA pseudouridine955/2504/2580 synthase